MLAERADGIRSKCVVQKKRVVQNALSSFMCSRLLDSEGGLREMRTEDSDMRKRKNM